MKRHTLILALLAFAVATMGQDGCETNGTETVPRDTTGSAPSTESGGKPSAEIDTKCDYLLGDFTDNSPKGYQFVGQAKIRNTGTGDVRVRVSGRWEQLGSDPLRQKKTVTVREGRTRVVRLKLLGTGDQVSAHQSAEGECKVTAKIVG